MLNFDQDVTDYQQAMTFHRSGKLAEAEAVYRKILARNPNHSEAWHSLGLVAYQVGNIPAAVELIERSVAIAPKVELSRCNLSEMYRLSGNLTKAAAICEQLVKENPKMGPAHANLAAIYRQQGNLIGAATAARNAIAIAPNDVGGYTSLGAIYLDEKRYAEALPVLEHARKSLPNDGALASNLGTCYGGLGDTARSLAEHHRAMTLEPKNTAILMNAGIALATAEKFPEAAICFERILALEPNRADAMQNLGAARIDCRNPAAAIPICERSLAIDPNRIETYITMGNAYTAMGEYEAAIAIMRKALTIQPTPGVYQSLINSSIYAGRREEALAIVEEALKFSPTDPISRFARAVVLITLGRLEEAWPEYELRWEHPKLKGIVPRFQRPRWQVGKNEGLAGKRILLHAEQGLGDTVFFGRYATKVAELVGPKGAVILRVQPSLVELMKSVPGVSRVTSDEERLAADEFDLHAPIMSLPAHFNTSLATIPATVPYIKADAEKKEYWVAELAKRTSKMKVGICWEGGAAQPENYLRSASLAAFGGLKDVKGVTFFSLQKGPAAEQMKNPPAGLELIDLAAEINDFSDTAAIIDALDLVISVDTSVVHIAGALGKPVWNLLALNRGHMWMSPRLDCPWYPTMRIFRQWKFNDWPGVMNEVAKELEKLAG